MKLPALTSSLLLIAAFCTAQTPDPNHTFSPAQLKADLAFVKQQLFNAHANPFTELTKTAYENALGKIDAQLTDSMTATGFFKLVRPAVAYLSDEHAQISLPANLQTTEYKTGDIFLPFTLSRKGNSYLVGDILSANSGLNQGDVITQINNQPVAQLIARAANYTTGFPDQRADNALQQFGYLYTLSQPGMQHSFAVKTANDKTLNVSGTTYNKWYDYLVAKLGMAGSSGKTITYNRYGNAGYITVTAFNARNDRQMDSLRKVVASMFAQVKADGLKYLFIDVSRNGGGNSAVGDMMTDFFYNKPYRGYQCNWKRSDEYLALTKSWGIKDDFYASQPVGKVIHFDSENQNVSADNPVRFGGKTYVVVGDGTFSSAIMFATTIKDNHIATLIGQTPKEGHPNHFGEMYSTKLPNTKLDIRFGVKEWIRPAGKNGENILRPDITVGLTKGPEEVVKQVIK